MKIGYCKGTRCNRLYQEMVKPFKLKGYYCAGGSAMIDDFTPIRLIDQEWCDSRKSRYFNQQDNRESAFASNMVREFVID